MGINEVKYYPHQLCAIHGIFVQISLLVDEKKSHEIWRSSILWSFGLVLRHAGGLNGPMSAWTVPWLGVKPRVEFSKPNIEISILVTKASKPRSFEASVSYIVIIFIIFLIIFIIMFLIILTIFFSNIFSSFLAAFLYSKKGAKIEERTHRSSIPCKNVKIMKKCSKNALKML